MYTRPQELRRGIENLVTFLGLPSGATVFQLRKAAYYAALTYHLHEFEHNPYLALNGGEGVGRSSLLKALSLFCYDSVIIDVSSETPTTLRGKLREARARTVMLDGNAGSRVRAEAGAYLSQRHAAQPTGAPETIPGGESPSAGQPHPAFGATVVHLEEQFENLELVLRGVWLNLQANESRPKDDYLEIPDSLIEIARENLSSTVGMPFAEAEVPPHMHERIARPYIPFLRMAETIDDNGFVRELQTEMRLVDASVREGESYTRKALVLKALIGSLAADAREDLNLGRSVALDREVCRYMQHHYMRSMSPRTAARHLRELGFEVHVVGGHTKVVDLTLPQLARACREAAVNDELVARKIAEVSADRRGDISRSTP